MAKGVGEYSEATDVFEIMDHVTRWDPKLTEVYRKAWEKKYPIDLETKSDFSTYAEIRLKFYEKHKEEPIEYDIFGKPDIGYDLFSEAFYSSKSVGEALQKLETRGVEKESLKFLISFYRKYRKKIRSFIEESSHFSVKVMELNNTWKKQKLNRTTKKITKFVLGKKGRKFNLLLRPVWWPKNAVPQINVRGPFLILRFNPLDKNQQFSAKELAAASVNAILKNQPHAQRKNLTSIFRSNCNGREIELKAALTILFGTVYPESVAKKKTFDLYANWSRSEFVDLYVKLLFPLFTRESKGSKNVFAGTFMDQATLLCKKIHNL